MTLKSLIQQLVDLFHCIAKKDLSFLIDIIRLGIAYNYLKRSPAKLMFEFYCRTIITREQGGGASEKRSAVGFCLGRGLFGSYNSD